MNIDWSDDAIDAALWQMRSLRILGGDERAIAKAALDAALQAQSTEPMEISIPLRNGKGEVWGYWMRNKEGKFDAYPILYD